jgi:hypothetical protein
MHNAKISFTNMRMVDFLFVLEARGADTHAG